MQSKDECGGDLKRVHGGPAEKHCPNRDFASSRDKKKNQALFL
jgi:hypothetical protein